MKNSWLEVPLSICRVTTLSSAPASASPLLANFVSARLRVRIHAVVWQCKHAGQFQTHLMNGRAINCNQNIVNVDPSTDVIPVAIK